MRWNLRGALVDLEGASRRGMSFSTGVLLGCSRSRRRSATASVVTRIAAVGAVGPWHRRRRYRVEPAAVHLPGRLSGRGGAWVSWRESPSSASMNWQRPGAARRSPRPKWSWALEARRPRLSSRARLITPPRQRPAGRSTAAERSKVFFIATFEPAALLTDEAQASQGVCTSSKITSVGQRGRALNPILFSFLFPIRTPGGLLVVDDESRCDALLCLESWCRRFCERVRETTRPTPGVW